MEAAAAAGEEGCSVPIWSATTNWIAAADGSLGDAISFDTSEGIENEQEEAKPLVLLRPEEGDPPPCEITICFRKKHEIHMVYVRSTARVYEIHYSSDHRDNSKEYLSTVRCGTAARPDQMSRSDSNNSDEDGWVQVKSPDSLLQGDKEPSMSRKCDIGIDNPVMQIHYEATAEISDSNPCISLTLRLISIQTKAYVHIEEIYVYADPVDSANSDPPVSMGENLGGSSLAMLVPSLMQLSKSEASQEKCVSEDSRVLKYQFGTEKTAQTDSSDMENTVLQEACSWRSPNQKSGTDQEHNEVKPKVVSLDSTQEVTASHQMINSLVDQNNNQAYIHLETVLDELVLKVGRVEAFCSKFEENMLNPLSCMEQRLQLLEQKLDALAVKSQSSEQCPCSKISEQCQSSESDKYDSKNKGGNTKHRKSREDTSFSGTASLVDEVEPSVLESQTRPGLVMKAPEFLNEDGHCSNIEDTLDPLMDDFLKNKKPLSIDSAVASSLAASLTSTTVKSPKPISSLMAISQESVNGNNSSLVEVHSQGASDTSVIEDNGCDFLDAARKGTCFDGSSLLSCDAAIVNDEHSSDKFDAVTDGTAFDDSLLIANGDVSSPAFPAETGSGFLVMPPEFLNGYSSFNCDDTSDLLGLDCLEDRALIPTFRQTIPPLAEFLSSTAVQSPKSNPAPFNVPSGLYSIDSNELSASTVVVPSEGADVSRIEDQNKNEMKDEVYLEPIQSISPLEAIFAQKLLNCTLFELTELVSQNCHGRSVADNGNAEKAVLHGVDQHGRGWAEDSSSTSSSFHENLIKTEWSVGGSNDSSRETSMVTDNSKFRASTSNYEREPAFVLQRDFSHVDDTITRQSSRGCSQERSNKELEDMMYNIVKFTSEGNWTSELPLDLLLGMMPDTKLPVASATGGDGELHSSSSSSQGTDGEADADGSFLSEVPRCPESPTLTGR